MGALDVHEITYGPQLTFESRFSSYNFLKSKFWCGKKTKQNKAKYAFLCFPKLDLISTLNPISVGFSRVTQVAQ